MSLTSEVAPSGERIWRKGRHGVFAGKTVWSMPERFEIYIVPVYKRHYINTLPFHFLSYASCLTPVYTLYFQSAHPLSAARPYCIQCLEYLRPRALILLKTLALYKPCTYLLLTYILSRLCNVSSTYHNMHYVCIERWRIQQGSSTRRHLPLKVKK